MVELKKLYKTDTKGKTRIWWAEHDEDKYRNHSGILDGNIVTSGWKYPKPKNVGKANETSVSSQVTLEVDALYEKKLSQGNYHETIEGAGTGAHYVEPMLAIKFNPKKHTNFPYHGQPKLDGIRCLISKDGMFSRQGKPITSCPHIWQEVNRVFEKYPDIVFDGELYNHKLKDEFEKIVSLVRKVDPDERHLLEAEQLVEYHVYDIVESPDIYENRLMRIFSMTFDLSYIFPVETVVLDGLEDVDSYLSECIEDGFEGAMIRCMSTPYEHKRSNSLMKHKLFEDAEFTIVNIVEGVGNWAGFAKSIEILLPDGTTQHSGMRGDQEFAKSILDKAEVLIGTQVTVRYQGLTSDNKMRFPVVVKFWEGRREL